MEELKTTDENPTLDLSPEISETEEFVIASDDSKESKPLTKEQIIKALRGAVKDGTLGAMHARRIRQDLGIFNSTFTRKVLSDKTRKAKRKAQKNARRKQRNK